MVYFYLEHTSLIKSITLILSLRCPVVFGAENQFIWKKWLKDYIPIIHPLRCFYSKLIKKKNVNAPGLRDSALLYIISF